MEVLREEKEALLSSWLFILCHQQTSVVLTQKDPNISGLVQDLVWRHLVLRMDSYKNVHWAQWEVGCIMRLVFWEMSLDELPESSYSSVGLQQTLLLRQSTKKYMRWIGTTAEHLQVIQIADGNYWSHKHSFLSQTRSFMLCSRAHV